MYTVYSTTDMSGCRFTVKRYLYTFIRAVSIHRYTAYSALQYRYCTYRFSSSSFPRQPVGSYSCIAVLLSSRSLGTTVVQVDYCMESSSEPPVLRAALFPLDKLWEKSWRIFPGEATIRKRMNTRNPELIFYSSWFCPFAQRTWIALEESGVKYKWEEVRN
jgi:hypothetical protein